MDTYYRVEVVKVREADGIAFLRRGAQPRETRMSWDDFQRTHPQVAAALLEQLHQGSRRAG